jgi:hypothetical protein
MAESLTGLEGVYNWSYSGGSFQVELRPFGSFYCKSYPASATWALVDKKVTVDWKKFGKYELEVYLVPLLIWVSVSFNSKSPSNMIGAIYVF